MRLLVTYPLSHKILSGNLGDEFMYAPELTHNEILNQESISEIINCTDIDIVLLPAQACLNEDQIRAWRTRNLVRPLAIIKQEDQEAPQGENARIEVEAARKYNIEILRLCLSEIWKLPSSKDIEAYRESLDRQVISLAEGWYHRKHSHDKLFTLYERALAKREKTSSALIVGAGIVGLVIAYRLWKLGLKVHVIDGNSNPRDKPDFSLWRSTSWQFDARQVTTTELHGYNWPDVVNKLRLNIDQDGWLAVGAQGNGLVANEKSWIEDHKRFSSLHWRERLYTHDTMMFNRESLALWREMRLALPAIFEDAGFSDSIVRVYTCQKMFQQALKTQLYSGDKSVQVLSPTETAQRISSLSWMLQRGQIAGSILVDGFSIGARTFCHNLVDYLLDRGVKFSWGERVTEWSRDEAGKIQAALTENGRQIRSDHYIASPGAYSNFIFNQTRAKNRIMGLAGAWISLPNPGLPHSIKIHHHLTPVNDINVTLTSDARQVAFSAGYAFIGQDIEDRNSPMLTEMVDRLKKMAQQIFPEQFNLAEREFFLGPGVAIRPFDSAGLAVFEVQEATEGLFILAGGHGTGGLTQAPVTALAVERLLRGEPHPIHLAYHPERVSR